VEADTVGRKHRLQGTPAWLVGERLITGLRPTAEFERLAEQAIAASTRSPTRIGESTR
jgi:hypothetical protein